MINSISILYRKTQMYLNSQQHSLHMTNGQIPFIICICKNRGISQNRLAEILDIDKSTVTKMLNKLETDGYINRKQKSDNLRCFSIYPTEKALQVYTPAIEAGQNWECELTKGLTEIEILVLNQLVNKLVTNVKNYFDATKKDFQDGE